MTALPPPPHDSALQGHDPGKTGELVELLTQPGKAKALARHLGVPPADVRDMLATLRARYHDAFLPRERLSNKELIDELDRLTAEALRHLPGKMKTATAQQLIMVAAIAIDKRLLLEGRPTSIVKHQNRVNMNRLWPRLLKEAHRRGLIIDATADDVVIEDPQDPPKYPF